MTLRVGIAAMPTSAAGVELVRQAERLGVDSVWVPEFWAADALTPLAYLAGQTSTIRLATGIVQLGARTPAMLAMSAMSLQALSGGRFVLGIGSSGPQVMEGWHGVRFDKPVRRTRETIDIIRTVTAGHRLEYDGEIYQLPLAGGEGRAIRSLMPPTHVPIYTSPMRDLEQRRPVLADHRDARVRPRPKRSSSTPSTWRATSPSWHAASRRPAGR